MVIGVDMGHSLSGAGTGATGVMKEVEKNREVGHRLIQMLQEHGHTVINCTVDYANSVNEQLANIVNKANAQHLDYFVSLHLNSHKDQTANGTETWIYNGQYSNKNETRAFAERVNNAVVHSCGFRNRGVKEGGYYVCGYTNATAILVEICFCSSPVDKDKWNTENIARGLFKGIIGADYNTRERAWKVGDHCKMHGYVTQYNSGDTVSPHDYFHRITAINGETVELEPVYEPKRTLSVGDIYR